MLGKTLGHYRILERLGKGGAGDVYLAEDTKLGRRVALKVLKPSMSDDEMVLLSFKREAQALAALSHPGIVTVYSVEEVDGTHFLTMELIEGRPLRKMLPRQGMRLNEFLAIALPLSEALAAAHEQGIIHRDLKPRNIMVGSDGRVIVVDFGLAKLKHGSAKDSKNPTETLFRKGEIRGTIPYMSPEQVVGKPCGPPTDVFSLGTTMYMMLTGHRPFDGKNAMEIISRIVRLDPEPITTHRPDLPRQLVRIVRRCLSKDLERRYPSAREVHNELSELRQELEGDETTTIDRESVPWLAADDTTTVITIHGARRKISAILGGLALIAVIALGWALYGRGTAEPTAESTPAEAAVEARVLMAVLPFLNRSGDPDQEYLSDGLTEETITQLGRLQPERLGVIARTSVSRFKNSDLPVDAISELLGVDYVLEGSVVADGQRLRVTVNLIESDGQMQLWSESYEDDLSDVHHIQTDIARQVATALAGELLPGEAVELLEPPTVDPEAYEAYLRGWHLWNQVTPASIARSIEYFERAVEIAPRYAPAWSGLAAAHHVQGSADFVADREAYPAARAAAERALEIDPELADAYASLGSIFHNYEWDWGEADRAFLRALELEPNSAFARHRYALLQSSLGRHDEALEQMRLAVELDPLSPLTRWNLGVRLWLAGDVDGAVEELERLPELAPGFGAEVVRGLIALLRQDYEGAVGELEAAAEENPDASRELLGFAYGKAGRVEDAQRILDEMDTAMISGEYVPLIDRIAVYGASGQLDQAFTLLEQAYEERDDALADLKSSLMLSPLRSDPRYDEFLDRMKLPVD